MGHLFFYLAAVAACLLWSAAFTAAAAGTLLFIDNAVAAEGRMLRVEAAQLVDTALPPAPATDDDALPL